MKMTKGDTVAIVIDYQEKLVPAMANHEELINKSKMMLGGLCALEIPLIATTQYAKGLGDTIPEIAQLLENAPIFDKSSFSVMDSPEVKATIPRGTKHIIVCGMETHICVLQSIMDLQNAGYQTYLVADCVSSRSESDKAFALVRAEQEGAKITTAEAVLYELLQGAKHPAFKTISALVK